MSNYEIRARRVEADEIDPGFRELYCELLMGDFARNTNMTPVEATHAAFGSPKNSLDKLRRTAEKPDMANIYVVNSSGTSDPLAVLKAGYEHDGDLEDGGGLDSDLLRWRLRIRRKVFNDLTSSALQVFAWGGSDTLSDSSDPEVQQLAFNAAVFAAHDDHPFAERLSAYVDESDSSLSKLMRDVYPRTHRVGSRTVEITLGDVAGSYRRHTVKLPTVRD